MFSILVFFFHGFALNEALYNGLICFFFFQFGGWGVMNLQCGV